MLRKASLSYLVATFMLLLDVGSAFTLPLPSSTTSLYADANTNYALTKVRVPISATSLRQTNSNDDQDMENLRKEIEEMKKSALKKLDALDDKIDAPASASVSASLALETAVEEKDSSVATEVVAAMPRTTEELYGEKEGQSTDDLLAQRYARERENDRIAISNKVPTSTSTTTTASSSKRLRSEELLDGSNWKMSLDIGRERGTWMPDDWGIKGDRLKFNFDMTLSDQQLYEREEFLGSMGDAKVLTVNNEEMKLSPSLTEGQRVIRLKNGGWRVARGQGPMGTSLLKFYVEVEEQVSRPGGDVYLPKGRIYCNCGFFDMRQSAPGSMMGEKAMFKKKLDGMMTRAEQLDDEIANAGAFSFEGVKKNAELFRLKVDMQRTAESLQITSVTEPDASLLRFCSSGDAGVTKEGGVCCKVFKGGVALEYHILGRFYIQSSRE